MFNSKICRRHAAKCIETAESIPPRAQREMFFDMAKRWTDLAINIESSEALADPASPPANDPGEPYRFGSRIRKAPTRCGSVAERSVRVMSVIPLKADIRRREWHVRYVP